MNIINNDCIFLEENLQNKDDVLRKLAEISLNLGVANDKDLVYKAFLAREEIGSTGMVNEFAIPHAKSEAITQAQILYLRNQSGIEDWETLDDTKVKLIVALLVPAENKDNQHLQILSNVSRKLMKDENIEILRNSQSKDEIINLLSE